MIVSIFFYISIFYTKNTRILRPFWTLKYQHKDTFFFAHDKNIYNKNKKLTHFNTQPPSVFPSLNFLCSYYNSEIKTAKITSIEKKNPRRNTKVTPGLFRLGANYGSTAVGPTAMVNQLRRRCSRASYIITPAATLTFNDATSPTMGKQARTSLSFSSSGLIPVSSLPIISRVGFVKSTSR